MRRTRIALAFVTATFFATPAFAQDVATAEALFNKGVADIDAGKFDTACPAIGESYRLDPRPGTLFTLAECYAKAGKTASAVARYQDYIELFARLPPDLQAKQHGRDAIAAAQKAALAPKVPLLTLILAPDAPPGTVVKRDDVVLGGPSIGLPLPVDPGDHVITATPPNGGAVTEKIALAPGEKKTVTLAPKAAEGAPIASGAGPVADNGSSGSTARPSGTQRAAGLVIGGVGVAGLIVGAVTGGLTLSKKSTATGDGCVLDAHSCKNAAGLSAVNSAQTTGMISTIGFIVGGVGGAGGAVLFFTAPKKSDSAALAPRVGLTVNGGPGAARLGAVGTF